MSNKESNQHFQLLKHLFLRESSAPKISIVITIFNQADLISSVIEAIVRCSSLPLHLILIDDCSEDNSREVVSFLLQKFEDSPTNFKFLDQVSFYGSDRSCFETACDDFGIRRASTDVVILVQGDVLIEEYGFDQILKSSLLSSSDYLMISGRGTEPITPILRYFEASLGTVVSLSRVSRLVTFFPKSRYLGVLLVSIAWFIYIIESLIKRGYRNQANRNFCERQELLLPDSTEFTQTGRAGEFYGSSSRPISKTRNIWVGQTVMRGPLALNRNFYTKLGGFDRDCYFLGFDDHDLAVRGFHEMGLRCGYTPISYRSELSWGSTRKKRTLKQVHLALKEIRRISIHRGKSSLYRARNYPTPFFPVPVIRRYELQ